MRKLVSFILLFSLAVAVSHGNSIQRSQFGVGVMAGEPTGLSLKTWLSDRTALDAGVAWSFEGRDSLHLHASHLWHDFDLITVERGSMPVYFGIGARYKQRSNQSDRFGIRAPIGVAYHFPDQPIEVFAEIAPIFDLSPSSQILGNGAIGVRFYFD